MKPRVFIGASKQRLDVAHAIQANLYEDANVTVWNQGIFGLSQHSLDSLLIALDQIDFGVFVFAPDDQVRIDDEQLFTVRDNILFESGLFAGRLGRERIFFVVPKSARNTHIASDLNGLTFGYYDERQASTTNNQAALGPLCEAIRNRMNVLPRNSGKVPASILFSAAYVLQRLSRIGQAKDLDVPTACLHIHQFAQSTFHELWSEHGVIVSLKLVDPESLDENGNPTQFRCYYPQGVPPDPEVFGYGNIERPVLPIKGSIAGDAYRLGEAQFVPDVAREKERFDPELYDRIRDKIGSIVAWPLCLNNEVAAILKVQARTPHLLSSQNEQFMALMTLIVAKFEVVLQFFSILVSPDHFKEATVREFEKRT